MTDFRAKTNPELMSSQSVESRHDLFRELCALATTGTLTDKEWSELKAHLSQCKECSALLPKYREIARSGMPLLISEESVGDHDGQESWTPELAKTELFTRIARGEQVGWTRDAAVPANSLRKGFWTHFQIRHWHGGLRYAVSFVLVAVLLGSVYRFGVSKGRWIGRSDAGSSTTEVSDLQRQMEALKREKASLDEQVLARNSQIEELSKQMEVSIGDLAKMKAQQKQAESNLEQDSAELSAARSQNTSVVAERDAIAGKLQDAESSVTSLRAALNNLRENRTNDLLRTASLEDQIKDLSGRVKKQNTLSPEDAQLLASDRDIRELMGARDLYIADVFDVAPNGQTEKSFGRIFYTRGKSLVFYAFDLDKQRGVRSVNAFQAWGRRGLHDGSPVNMGIFYLDNETNRRWVLKFDDPATLAKIDTIFVTVEPKGGSQEPRGKPFLVASLASQPNHP
jgi:predicted  nucleic acid-binding Zn-ribbon protein